MEHRVVARGAPASAVPDAQARRAVTEIWIVDRRASGLRMAARTQEDSRARLEAVDSNLVSVLVVWLERLAGQVWRLPLLERLAARMQAVWLRVASLFRALASQQEPPAGARWVWPMAAPKLAWQQQEVQVSPEHVRARPAWQQQEPAEGLLWRSVRQRQGRQAQQ